MVEYTDKPGRVSRAALIIWLPRLMEDLQSVAGPNDQLELLGLVKLRPDWNVNELSATIAAVAAIDPTSLAKCQRIVRDWWSNTVLREPEEIFEVAEDSRQPENEGAQDRTETNIATDSDAGTSGSNSQRGNVIWQFVVQFRYWVLFPLICSVCGFVFIFSSGLVPSIPQVITDLIGSQPPVGDDTTTTPVGRTSQISVVAALVLLMIIVVISITGLVQTFRIRQREQSQTNQDLKKIGRMPSGASFLPLGLIGGASAPVFSGKDATGFSRVVPMREDEALTSRLDPDRTVARWSETGQPALQYKRARIPWPVLVLEDRASRARPWSNVAGQVVEALKDGGIDASVGEFDGHLDRVFMEDGRIVSLRKLMALESLFVVCSDGEGLSRNETDAERQASVLRTWARSGRVIWIDDREPRFWRPDLDVHLGLRPALPVVAAESMDLLSALGRLSVGQAQGTNQPFPETRVRPVNLSSDMSMSARRASLLGDAIGWAAACSVIQPISVGLADAIRRRFFSHLPMLAFGRLVALDGARLTMDGLKFSTRDQRFLRGWFLEEIKENRQEEIFKLIEDTISAFQKNFDLEESSLAARMLQLHEGTFLYDRGDAKGAEKLGGLSNTLLLGQARDVIESRVLPTQRELALSDGLPVLRALQDYPKAQKSLEPLSRSMALDLPNPWIVTSAPSSSGVRTQAPGVHCEFDPQSGRILVVDESGLVTLAEEDGTIVGSIALKSGPPEKVTMARNGETFAIASRGDVQVFAAGEGSEFFELPIDSGNKRERIRDMVLFDHEGSRYLALQSERIELFNVGPKFAESLRFFEETPVIGLYADDQTSLTQFYLLTFDEIFLFEMEPTQFNTEGDAPLPNNLRAIKEGGLEWVSQLGIGDAVAIAVLNPNEDQVPAVVLAIVGDGQLRVQLPDGAVYGPWPIFSSDIQALEIVDRNAPEGPAIAVLSSGKVEVIHAKTGIHLNEHDAPNQAEHAALGVDRGVAVVWTEDRYGVDIHTYSRPEGAGARPERASKSTETPVQTGQDNMTAAV